MADEVVAPRASFAVEMLDELTQGPLVGENTVTADVAFVDAVRSFRVGASRWIFENLPGNVTMDVAAQFYLPQQFTTGASSVPAVPSAGQPGVLHQVTMVPAPGYPFAATLTRVIGEVRLDSTLDSAEPTVPDIEVRVFAIHDAVEEPIPQIRRTTPNGQYTVWFFADPDADPRLATAFRVEVLATSISIGGVPTNVAGQIASTPLIPQAVTYAPALRLEAV